MVKLQAIKSANLDLVKSQPLVAVFAGGTSGIGEYTVRALANAHAGVGRGLRVYIVGRNESAAQKVIGECQQTCPNGRFVFVQAGDLALLRDVDTLCKRVIDMEQQEESPRIDILVMTQACPPWRPYLETTEGIETLTSLLYYSRMRMITKLLPLLTASTLPAHVISVYAAGMEGKLLIDDLSLRKPEHQGLSQVRSQVTYMTALYMDYLAHQHPGKLSMIHAFPGLVETPSFQDPQMPYWLKLVWTWLGKAIIWIAAVPADECGVRILSLATSRYPARRTEADGQSSPSTVSGTEPVSGYDGVPASGVYSINWNGESCATAKTYQKLNKSEVSKMVVDHTNKAFEIIESGGTFKE